MMHAQRRRSSLLLLVTTGVFVFLAACGPGNTEGEDPPWPKGIVVETPTPDTRGTVGREEGEEKLRKTNEAFADVIAAVKSGDVESLLSLVDWQERSCGQATRTYCPGLPDGTIVEAVNAGSAVDLWVSADGLIPHLELMLAGAPLQLDLAAVLKDEPGEFYVGFDGSEVKGKGLGTITDPDLSLTGLILVMNASSPRPIVRFDLSLNEFSHAADKAVELGLDRFELITFIERSRVTPASTPPVAKDE